MPVSMAELDFHLVEVSFHLLLKPDGLVSAAGFRIQGGLQGIYGTLLVSPEKDRKGGWKDFPLCAGTLKYLQQYFTFCKGLPSSVFLTDIGSTDGQHTYISSASLLADVLQTLS